jgi:hypothetical protein
MAPLARARSSSFVPEAAAAVRVPAASLAATTQAPPRRSRGPRSKTAKASSKSWGAAVSLRASTRKPAKPLRPAPLACRRWGARGSFPRPRATRPQMAADGLRSIVAESGAIDAMSRPFPRRTGLSRRRQWFRTSLQEARCTCRAPCNRCHCSRSGGMFRRPRSVALLHSRGRWCGCTPRRASAGSGEGSTATCTPWRHLVRSRRPGLPRCCSPRWCVGRTSPSLPSSSPA